MRAIFFALCAIFAGTNSMRLTEPTAATPLLGANHCTWGPSYWCTNITTASGCKSTAHCIKTDWEKRKVVDDDDSVCDICKKMVQTARDQLESNETQEEMKEVFEGSCKLMIIKPIVEECSKLVDQFIPDLIETLASQMNPAVVCSVSGLCNSPRIDKLLADHEKSMKKITGKEWAIPLKDDELEPDQCTKCYMVATHMEDKFNKSSHDNVLKRMLYACGLLGSYADACANYILTYNQNIFNYLHSNFKADSICHLSGQCTSKFHKHTDGEEKVLEVDIRPMSMIGMVEVDDDLPCDLCTQLVGHLRDLLVTNTTENEFREILTGFCHQTHEFASECVNLVDQYYAKAYEYLVHRLDGKAVCELATICPTPGKKFPGPIAPLLTGGASEIGVRLMNEEKLEVQNAKREEIEVDSMQLPMERFHNPLTIFSYASEKGRETCIVCEYLLHYIQEIMTFPSTEASLKTVLEKVCKKLPNAFEGECDEIVTTYSDVIIALLVQEIDPAVVCPKINLCPSENVKNLLAQFSKEIIKSSVEDKPSCPLCIFAVSQVCSEIKDNRTEQSIEEALRKLCKKMPHDWNNECETLVNDYSEKMIQLLISHCDPQEACVDLKFCNPTRKVVPMNFFPLDKQGEIVSNNIPDYEIVPLHEIGGDTNCEICKFLMKYVEDAMRNQATKNEIEDIVHGICNYLPAKYGEKCNNFVNEYADMVLDLLSREVTPGEICAAINLCNDNMDKLMLSINECAVCQAIVSPVDAELLLPESERNLEKAVGSACSNIKKNNQKCVTMIEAYRPSILNLLHAGTESKDICTKLALCSSSDVYVMSKGLLRGRRADDILSTKKCTWGAEYICGSPEVRAACNVQNTDFCKAFDQEKRSAEARTSSHHDAAEVTANP